MTDTELQKVCYTRELALELAIEMESNAFQVYKKGYVAAEDPPAKDLLRDLALDELRHRYQLEQAFFEDTVALHDAGYRVGPSVKLDLPLEGKPLSASSSHEDVLIYAIQEEKRAIAFYRGMASQCGGAPMEAMFQAMAEDEEGHMARLEALYQDLYGSGAGAAT